MSREIITAREYGIARFPRGRVDALAFVGPSLGVACGIGGGGRCGRSDGRSGRGGCCALRSGLAVCFAAVFLEFGGGVEAEGATWAYAGIRA